LKREYVLSRTEAPQLGRFVAAGAVNTLLSCAIYQLALFAVGHIPAYVIAYIAGTAIAYFGYSKYVFRTGLWSGQPVLFVLFYAFSLGAGTAVNAMMVEYWGVSERIAIFATIALMLPFNYLGSRWCLRGGSPGARADPAEKALR
jgi:putative flippase GtrA